MLEDDRIKFLIDTWKGEKCQKQADLCEKTLKCWNACFVGDIWDTTHPSQSRMKADPNLELLMVYLQELWRSI